MTLSHKKLTRGFMTVDAIAGLVLLAGLATLLVVALGARERSARQVTAARQAQMLAEASLAKLRAGEKVDETAVTITTTGVRVGQAEWVEITTNCEGRSATICGLVKPRKGNLNAK